MSPLNRLRALLATSVRDSHRQVLLELRWHAVIRKVWRLHGCQRWIGRGPFEREAAVIIHGPWSMLRGCLRRIREQANSIARTPQIASAARTVSKKCQ